MRLVDYDIHGIGCVANLGLKLNADIILFSYGSVDLIILDRSFLNRILELVGQVYTGNLEKADVGIALLVQGDLQAFLHLSVDSVSGGEKRVGIVAGGRIVERFNYMLLTGVQVALSILHVELEEIA